MKIEINVPEHKSCSNGCRISDGDRATAKAWGITNTEAHAIAFSTIKILSEVFGVR